MLMYSLEEIRERLKDRRPGIVAEESGVPYHTIWRIMTKPNRAVTYDAVEKLSRYLEQNP